MCGIAGIFDLRGESIDRDLLARMTERIRHRGPDGEGYYVSQSIGLGSRRLSIIDLEGGSQPQSNEDESVQVVFNGEIFNFVELRQELIAHGHQFKTRSDTEVIVHAYEQWGCECVRRFNGMFAFALWDERRAALLLARDHLGIKPLYYVTVGNRLLFASEIKALLADPDCPRDVDLPALSQLFTLRYVPSPQTLFRGIQKLPPGHSMVATRAGMEINRYWKWTPKHRRPKENECVEEYRALVQDAVHLQMRSDVPVGLFLSAGVDSGSLLAIVNEHAGDRLHTFTIGFEGGDESNETHEARALAKKFGSDHSEWMIGPADYESYYQRYQRDLEEPVGNEAAAAFYFVSLMASRKVKVALSGQGADEPWAGYGRHLGVKLSQYYSRLPGMLTKGVLGRFGRHFVKNEVWKRGLSSLHERDPLLRLVAMYSIFTPGMKEQLFQPWLKEKVSTDGAEALEALQVLQSDVRALDDLTQILYIDTRTTLPDNLLMVGDKTSMANSLEMRVPFLDYRLIEFAESLPSSMKLRGAAGKYLHKKAMEKWLPKDAVHRKKIGFATPIAKWMRTSMRPFVRDTLLSENAAVRRYFDPAFVKALVEQHEGQKQQHHRHLHLLLSFELWHREFMTS